MYSLSLAEIEVQTRSTSLSVTVELDFKFNSSWNPKNALPTALAPITESGAGAAAGAVVGPESGEGNTVGTADSASVIVIPAQIEANQAHDPPSSVPSADSDAEASSNVPIEQSAIQEDTNPAPTGNSVQVTHTTHKCRHSVAPAVNRRQAG
jgi:hypothetical protein